jgi:plastocyanin
LVACLAAGLFAVMRDADAAPSTYVVTIEAMRFNPQTLTVQRGDRVVWTNRDLLPHTATASSKAFDSRSIVPNASWTYVPRKPGNYPYGCSFHPTMHAVLIVR